MRCLSELSTIERFDGIFVETHARQKKEKKRKGMPMSLH
jgi:hypothetical protein